MCKLSISVKNNYITLNVKGKTIKHLTSPTLERYTVVNSFDKDSGIVALNAKFNLINGNTVIDEDWIDLNDLLAFAFKNPAGIIREIDAIQLS